MGASSLSTAHKRGQDGPTVVFQSCWDGNRRLLDYLGCQVLLPGSLRHRCPRWCIRARRYQSRPQRATLTRSPRHAASRITRRRIAADFFTSGVRERVSRRIAAFRSTRFLAPPADHFRATRTRSGDNAQTVSARPPTPRQRHEAEIFAPPAPPRRGHVTDEITL